MKKASSSNSKSNKPSAQVALQNEFFHPSWGFHTRVHKFFRSVSGGAIEFDEAAGFEDGAAVEITYASKARTRLEGLVNSGINVQIVLDGFNLAEDDKEVNVTYHRVSLSPAAQRQLITSDYGEQEIKGTLLASKAVSGSGLSKLFREEYA